MSTANPGHCTITSESLTTRPAWQALVAHHADIDRIPIIDTAPGNGAPIGGIKVMSANGWFTARPSGTEGIYKIYAESFTDDVHLRRILEEAQTIVDNAIGAP